MTAETVIDQINLAIQRCSSPGEENIYTISTQNLIIDYLEDPSLKSVGNSDQWIPKILDALLKNEEITGFQIESHKFTVWRYI